MPYIREFQKQRTMKLILGLVLAAFSVQAAYALKCKTCNANSHCHDQFCRNAKGGCYVIQYSMDGFKTSDSGCATKEQCDDPTAAFCSSNMYESCTAECRSLAVMTLADLVTLAACALTGLLYFWYF